MVRRESGYVKAGYRFTGWSTTSDGTGTAYEAGEVLEAESLGGTLVLYAQWEEEEYAITYVLAGGTNNSSNPDVYKMSDAAITLADPEQTGYTFDGWYTDADFSAERKVTTIPGGSEGAITLYAKWTPHIYHVSFNANGGEGTMGTMRNLEYGKTYTFPANTFTREGYTFVGWSNYSDGSSTIYEDQKEFSSLVSYDNITIRMYAIWEKEGAGENPVEITSIKLKGISKKIVAGKKITLIPVWNPTNAANKTVTWTSSNKKYATVSAKGVVTTKKAGKGKFVKITAMATDGTGKKATIMIKIK